MPLESFQQRGLSLKIETTEGTDSSPTRTANAFRLLNGTSGLEAEKLERDLDRPQWGAKPFVPVGLYGFIEGDMEIVPAATGGTSAPIAPVLKIASFAETLVSGPPALARYTPIATAIPSATAYFQHAGVKRIITGARAKLSAISMEIKKYAMCKVRIEGNCADPTELTMPTDYDYSSFQDPLPINTENFTLSVNGFNVDGLMLQVDLNTEMKVKEHSEARIARISDRLPSGIVRFYRPAFTSLNPWALHRAGTTIAIVGTNNLTGSGARQVLLSVGKAQLEQPKEVEVDGDVAYECPFVCLPNAGNDEVKLELGGGT